MSPITSQQNHYHTYPFGNQLTIAISGQWTRRQLASVILWVFGWFIAISWFYPWLDEQEISGVNLFPLTILSWLFGCVYILAIVLWAWFGCEIIALDSQELSHSRSLFGINTHKTFPVDAIQHWRFLPETQNHTWQWVFSGNIAFDVQKETIRIGSRLTPREAENILTEIQHYWSSDSQDKIVSMEMSQS